MGRRRRNISPRAVIFALFSLLLILGRCVSVLEGESEATVVEERGGRLASLLRGWRWIVSHPPPPGGEPRLGSGPADALAAAVRSTPSPEEILYSDLTLAFANGLKAGIGGARPLTSNSSQALLDWFNLLSATLPPEFGLHLVLARLRGNWEYVGSSRENLMSILSKEIPADRDYSDECVAAGAGDAALSADLGLLPGSTCALWKLLHVVTVGVAEREGGGDLPRTKAFSPAQAMDVIKRYIENFATCELCRTNFVDHFDQCAYGRCDGRLAATTKGLTSTQWREPAMYMWRYHNGVSTSVAQELALRKQEGGDDNAARAAIARLWPSINDCPLCQNEDGTWNRGQVYEELEKIYWGNSEGKDEANDEYREEQGEFWHHELGVIILFVSAVTAIKIWSSWLSGTHGYKDVAKNQ